MFSEVLKILPKLDAKDLKAMESALQGRFTKLAKSFGKGLKATLMGGGIAGIALGLVDKLLNPLKEVQEAIDNTLKKSDDLATNANQFNTTSGKLLKLVTLAKASGLDQEGLFTLMNKFQGAVAQNKANPKDEATSAVRNFVGTKDTSDAFFQFIQSLQKMDKNQQVLVQQQVFGEKQILKMSDFLNSDFNKASKLTGVDKVSSGSLTTSVNKLGDLNDLKDALDAKREMNDIVAKSQVINEKMIRDRAKSEQMALDRENKQIQSYTDLASISQAADQIQGLVQEGVAMLGKVVTLVIPAVTKMANVAEKFLQSPMMRGIKSMFGGKKDE